VAKSFTDLQPAVSLGVAGHRNRLSLRGRAV